MSGQKHNRVAYVVKRYPRYSETFIVNEILAHEAAGLELEIFALRPPCDTHFQDGISRVRAPVHYLASRGVRMSDFWETLGGGAECVPNLWNALKAARHEDARDVHQAVLLAQAITERGITHLHAHFASAATTVSRIAADAARVPYTFTAHAKDIFHADVQPARLRQAMNSAAAAITVSDYNVRYLREHYGAAATSVQRIYSGLDLDRFAYSEPRDRPPTIVAVGRLIEKKGFADLVDACAALARQGREFACQIIGSGPLEQTLREQVARLGLERKIELRGPRPQHEVIEAVRSAAVFAAPCVIGDDGNRDGLPTVLLEAMALGTPCIATDVTGIPEAVQDGVTGLIVAQHSPAALAGAIGRLLDDPNECLRLAGQARLLIETEFDVHRNSARLRSLFVSAAPSAQPQVRAAL